MDPFIIIPIIVKAASVLIVPYLMGDQGGGSKPEFIREEDHKEFYEIIDTEEYFLDQTDSDDSFSSDYELSKTINVEFSVEKVEEIGSKIKVGVTEFVSSELSAKAKTAITEKLGATVTRKHAFTLSCMPRFLTVYKITWRRKIRTAKQVYQVGEAQISMEYKLIYDVVFGVASKQSRRNAS